MLPAKRIARSLHQIIEWCGKPLAPTANKGPEYHSSGRQRACILARTGGIDTPLDTGWAISRLAELSPHASDQGKQLTSVALIKVLGARDITIGSMQRMMAKPNRPTSLGPQGGARRNGQTGTGRSLCNSLPGETNIIAGPGAPLRRLRRAPEGRAHSDQRSPAQRGSVSDSSGQKLAASMTGSATSKRIRSEGFTASRTEARQTRHAM